MFEFSEGGSNKHPVVVSLSIAKKEGYLEIIERTNLNVIYENSLTLNVTFKDTYDIYQNITAIYVNGTWRYNDKDKYEYNPNDLSSWKVLDIK